MLKNETMNIPFAKPFVCCAEKKAVMRVLDSGHLTTGPETAELEKEFAQYVGSTYAVFVNSCTSALKLSLKWKAKEGVLTVGVPSLTFCATVNEVVEECLDPIFCDVFEENLCMDPASYTAYDVDCVDLWLPVHLGANWADMGSIPPEEIIYDSAHLIEPNCHVEGSISCYSFYPTKNMTTFEGGMICTDSKEMYEWLLKARHHGRAKAIGHVDVEFVSGKYNNTDVSAAVGREQLKQLSKFNARRDEIVGKYNEAFNQDWGGNHLYLIKVKEREKFLQLMKDAGIGVSVHFDPLHKMTAYEEYKDLDLPVTNRVGDQIVSLPLFVQLTDDEVEYICQKVKQSDLLLPWQE